MKLNNYWIYTIYVPSVEKYYVGCSRQFPAYKRFSKDKYKTKSINKYLDEYETWQFNIVVDNLNKEEALQLEQKIIDFYRKNDKLINKNNSGYITKDIKAYKRAWRNNRYKNKMNVK